MRMYKMMFWACSYPTVRQLTLNNEQTRNVFRIKFKAPIILRFMKKIIFHTNSKR